VPFATQAMGGEILKVGSDALKWTGRHSKAIVAGGVFLYLGWQLLEKMLKKWDYHKLKKELERSADDRKKELLAKVDKGELISGSSIWALSGGPYCLTFLNLKEMKKFSKAFDLLKVPKSSAEKILILDMRYRDYSEKKERYLAATFCKYNRTHVVPYSIIIDTKFLEKGSFFAQEFCITHEVGHIKAYYEGLLIGDEELNEVAADIYALNVFISRREKKNQLFDFVSEPYVIAKSSPPYLSPQELVYHGEQLFAAQEKGDKPDVLTYARKIVADRKKSGYEERIAQKARRLGLEAS